MKPQISCSSPGSDFSCIVEAEFQGNLERIQSAPEPGLSFYFWSYFGSRILIPSLINSKEHFESSLESSVSF